MLKIVGYWTDTKFHEMKWIDPKHLVDPGWEIARRARIIAYLRSGVFLCSDLGCSYCRFEDGPSDSEMGASELTDGVWVWPVGLVIYVERYHVRLPDEFIEYMAESNFTLPVDLDVRTLNRDRYDVSFWRAWCSREDKRIFAFVPGA
jgi:hypothetical protein